MSYYYQDTEYGYHGDVNHEYELYSDSAEPDHHYYEPPEPDYHNDCADRGNGGTPTRETEPEGPEYRDDELHEREPDWDAFEREEMEHRGYLHKEVQHEREVIHYQEVPEYEDDSMYRHDIHEHDDIEHTRAFAPANHDATELCAPSNTTHGPAHLMPTYVPFYPFQSTPAHTISTTRTNEVT